MSSKGKPVIIVGAGMSGLYAANILHEKKIPVIVMEAQERVGGRSYSEETPISGGGSAIVDHGAGYVGSTQYLVQDLCKTFKIETHNVLSEGKYTFSLGGEVHHSSFPLDDLFIYLKPVEFLAMCVTIIKTWSLGRTIPV